MSWDRMCEKKFTGGLGFRKLPEFNIALLGKQEWRVIVKPNNLVGKVCKAKYYPNGSFLTAKVGVRSIMEARQLLSRV